MRVFVEIHIPRLPSERRELLFQGYTLGSDERDTLRVAASSGLPPNAYDLRVSEAGVEISATANESPSIAHDGRHLRATHVRFGEEIYLGSVRLGFVAAAYLPMTRRTGSLLLVAVLLLLGTGGLFLLGEEFRETKESVAAPALFATAEECSLPSGETLEHWYDALLARARAKAVRFAFARRDGVRGVRLAREAESCATKGNDPARAQVAREFRLALEERVTDEYLSLQLRLRAAREQNRYQEALGAVAGLDEMLDEAGVEAGVGYRQMLSALRSSLSRKLDKN